MIIGELMKTTDQSICIWMLPFFCLLWLIAIGFYAGYLPPTSPQMSATQVAAFYRDNAPSLRTGLLIFNVCGAMIVPFFVVVVIQMQRMKLSSFAFSYGYLMCVAGGIGLYLLADLAWLLAAFRAERDPQLVQLLNDLGWLSFVAPVGLIVVQTITLGLAIMLDERREPIFPRWAGPFNIVAGLLCVPGAFSVIYKSGPLAWDGAIAFWLRLIAFGVYLVVMFFLVRIAVKNQAMTEMVAR